MRVYLDVCCYNRPYDDQSQLKVAMETESKLYIQKLIREQKLDLVGSFTLDYEVSRNPFEARRQSIMRFVRTYMKCYVGVERAGILGPIVARIIECGVKEKDAYHIASATLAKCDYFISTDTRLLKYKSNLIRLVTPIEFVTEMESEEL